MESIEEVLDSQVRQWQITFLLSSFLGKYQEESAMSESIRQTIEELKRHLAEIEAEAIDTKRTINSLCRRIGEPAMYGDEAMVTSLGAQQLNGDEYVGKPLATAVKLILAARKHAKLGPASVDEIYDALLAGGYESDAKSAEIAKRGLTISLAKNTTTFYKLQNGKFGLCAWYGKEQKARTNGARKAPLHNEATPDDDLAMSGKEEAMDEMDEADVETDGLEAVAEERGPAKAK